jgi:quinohemoprotein ethanol dehydrogenase
VWPSSLGAHNWQDMAYSPQTGLAYVPYMQLGVRFWTKPRPGDTLFGGVVFSAVAQDAEDGKGALLAWDPVAQKPRWRVQHQFCGTAAHWRPRATWSSRDRRRLVHRL